MDFQKEACLEKLRSQEKQFEVLRAKVDALAASAAKNAAVNQEGAELDAQIEALTKDNTKLKYRLNILKKAADKLGLPRPDIPGLSSSADCGEAGGGCGEGKEEEDELAGDDAMDNVIKRLEGFFRTATLEVFPQLKDPQISVHPASKPQFGDYQFNSAMGISKALAETGTKKPPRDIANAIVAKVPVGDSNPLIASLEVAGPGFVNIRLKNNYVCEGVRRVLKYGVKPPNMGKKRVVIDFSSPNIAKEMHVGHLRSTIIGECIARLLEYVGYSVLRINHLGDWGTQFGMLIAHLTEKFPNFKQETPAIGDLQALYKESKARFDEDGEFKKRAYAAVKALQSHDPDHILAWQQICDVSRKEFQKLYDRLDVTLTDRGESFYQSRMEAVVADLEAKGLLVEEDGRKLMFPNPKKSPLPLTVVKSDGSYTYDTSDMATVRQRIEEEKGDWLIYVTDEGQAAHFKSFLSCAEICGYWDTSKVRIDHVTFGVVLGEDRKKFKTRSGETIRLADLLDEGIRRAEEKLKEKGRDKEMSEEEFLAARDNVALGCVRYNDLCHNRNHEYVFSFDKMLEDKGNTAAYLLYQYTRIKSICRTAGVEEKAVIDSVADKPLELTHVKEINLAKTLLKFPVILERLLDDLLPHSLCDYLYEVSQVFSEFYDNCYCVEKDKETKKIAKIHFNRLALCEATTRIMAACFHILGLRTVHKM